MKSSIEKWPTVFNIVNVASSVLGEQFILYFVTSVSTKDQAEEVKKVIPILSETAIEADKVVLTTLIHKGQLKLLYETFAPRAKEWRGQYYALSQAIVEACKPNL
jgi:hypothetical protein